MLRLALRNLFQRCTRLLMSTGVVALALLLVLALDAIFAGSAAQVSAYIDNSRAEVWVAQAGVRNMHMAASSLPAAAADEVAGIAGVKSVTPIFYLCIGALAAAALVLVLLAGVPATTLLWFGLILACPLMMLFMHGGHGAAEHPDHSGRRESGHTPGGYH